MANNYESHPSKVFDQSLEIKPSYVPEGTENGYKEVIHHAIPVAIGQHILRGDQDYNDIFGISEVSRVLTEGYTFQSGVNAEDFAITSPENGGELIIGQVVSCNGKEWRGDKPFDILQAENFERRLSSNDSIDNAIKSLYTVRTGFKPEEVITREEEITRMLENEGRYELNVKIIKLDRPDEINWSQVNSLLYDN